MYREWKKIEFPVKYYVWISKQHGWEAERRNRWQDEVREYGRLVGGKGWKERVHDREEWKKFLRTARNRQILHVRMGWMNVSGEVFISNCYFKYNTRYHEASLSWMWPHVLWLVCTDVSEWPAPPQSTLTATHSFTTRYTTWQCILRREHSSRNMWLTFNMKFPKT